MDAVLVFSTGILETIIKESMKYGLISKVQYYGQRLVTIPIDITTTSCHAALLGVYVASVFLNGIICALEKKALEKRPR